MKRPPTWRPGRPVPDGEHPADHYACPCCGELPCGRADDPEDVDGPDPDDSP